ncbi:MAG: QueG-associated DUF1730 domain-containing protein, partial [Candidatus Tumulicola sp.]
MNPVELKSLAIATAQSLGAAEVRITEAAADGESRRRMRASFERGDLATWPYDGAYADRANDPSALLDGARSVVCLAFAYATPPPRQRPLRGRVSNYAWSRDYH